MKEFLLYLAGAALVAGAGWKSRRLWQMRDHVAVATMPPTLYRNDSWWKKEWCWPVALLVIGGVLLWYGAAYQTCEEIALDNVAQAKAAGRNEHYQEGVYVGTMIRCSEAEYTRADELWPQ
jgi:hypothetical protein